MDFSYLVSETVYEASRYSLHDELIVVDEEMVPSVKPDSVVVVIVPAAVDWDDEDVDEPLDD